MPSQRERIPEERKGHASEPMMVLLIVQAGDKEREKNFTKNLMKLITHCLYTPTSTCF
jgi:hypothetical protein